jgi:hypothetical protein
VTDPLPDPYAGGAPATRAGHAAPGALKLALLLVAAAALGGAVAVLGPRLFSSSYGISSRPTPSLITVIREVSRLETAEVHVEKVVDLTDKQSRFFDLIETKDALLLVAVGHATVGVDLSKVREGDVAFTPETGVASMILPEPEVFSATLDEGQTYVYARSTDLFAKRNEHLEANARREAVRAIEKAAMTSDVMARARAQAERQLKALGTQMGARHVEIHWR